MDEGTQAPERKTKKGLIIWVIVAVVVVAIAIFAFTSDGVRDSISGNGESGTVIATVDGRDITQADLDLRININRDAFVGQGINIDDEEQRQQLETELLTVLINEALVLNAAEATDVIVTEAQVDAQFDVIKGRFESEEAFQAQLAQGNISEKELKGNIKRELTIQSYIEQEVPGGSIAVTAEEVQTLYDELRAQAEADGSELIPELEEVEAQLENQIRQQRLGELVEGIVDSLRASAVISVTEEETTDSEEE